MLTNKNYLILLFLMAISLSSCEIIGGIFKAGMWVGILLVVVVIVGIIWLVGRIGKK